MGNSGIFHSTSRNTRNNAPPMVNIEITNELFQGYVDPPPLIELTIK